MSVCPSFYVTLNVCLPVTLAIDAWHEVTAPSEFF
jgi:hypothetical protein